VKRLASTLLALVALGGAAPKAEAVCRTKACERRVAAKKAWNLCVKRHGGELCTWRNRWRRLSPTARYWTRCVSARESGNRRVARESGHLSYFQWVLSTWHAAGGEGNPEVSATWYEQAVRAWRWHLSHPTGQWPNTGEGGRCLP